MARGIKTPMREQQVARTEAALDALMTDVDVRADVAALSADQEARLRREAKDVDVDYDVYLSLKPVQRRALHRLPVGPTYEQFAGGEVTAARRAEGELTQGMIDRRDASGLGDQLVDPDDPNKVWLYDPPIGGFHRGRSKCPKEQVRDQIKKGFSLEPIAPLYPRPDRVCDLCVESFNPEPYHGYSDNDVTMHQKARHAVLYTARQQTAEAEERRLAQEERRLQIAVMTRLLNQQSPPAREDQD